MNSKFYPSSVSSGARCRVKSAMPSPQDAPSAIPRAQSFLVSRPTTSNSKSFTANLAFKTSSARLRLPYLPKPQQKACSCRSSHSSPGTQELSKRNHNEKETASDSTVKQESDAAGHDAPYSQQSFSSMVSSPPLSPSVLYSELPLPQHMLLLVSSITFAACGAFIALVATAIPTLNAMRRAALAFERLADTAREELPGTMAAVRLSGMEISDLILELSDVSQEISDSVKSSARAVRAAEVGIRRLGAMAASQTLSILQEHASVPVEAVKPVVATAAETTRQAVAQAHKLVLGLSGMHILSNWIQKKKLEEQKKIAAGPDLDSLNEINN